jgi:RNA polymerase sigma factor (sigma-70 family)
MTRSDAVLREIRKLAPTADADGLTDRELLQRFAAERDEGAFAEVVRRHGPMVSGVCRRLLGQREDAEDVFQAAFLVLARKAAVVAWRESVGSYLYTVAYRLALETRTKRYRQKVRDAHASARPAADPLEEITGRELVALLDGELARLPERYRAPLLLCFLEAKTGEEAARQLGYSESTLKRRLHRGRALLEVRLRRRGVALSVAALSTLVLPSASSASVVREMAGAAARFVTGQPIAGEFVSSHAVGLARGLNRAVLLGRFKLVAAAVIALGGLAGGTYAVIGREGTAAPPEPPPVAVAAAAEPAGIQARTDRHGDPLPPGAVRRLGTIRWRHEDWVQRFALAPDGSVVASAAGRTVYLWEAATGKPRTHVSFPAAVHALWFAPDGKHVAVGGNDGFVRVVDLASGKEVHHFLAHQPQPRDYYTGVYGVLFLPDDRSLVSWGCDGTLRAWDPATGKALRQFATGLHPRAARLSPDGRWLAVEIRGPERPVRLWDVKTGDEVRGFAVRGEIGKLAFSPDGRTMAVTIGKLEDPGQVTFWDTASGAETGTLRGHKSAIFAVAFAPDGKTLATGGYDQTIRLWDRASGKELHTIGPLGTPVYEVAFTADGKTLFAHGAENTLRRWDVTTARERVGPEGPEWHVGVIALAPSGKWLAAASARTIWLWDPATTRVLRKLQGHQSPISDLALSADGTRLVSSDQSGTVRLWDPATGRELRRIQAAPRWLEHVTISPDGTVIAAGGSEDKPHEIGLWDARTGNLLRRLRVTSEQPQARPTVQRLAFSPDGKTLVACSGTHVLVLRWDVATGKELAAFGPLDGGGNDVAISSDGRSVAAVSADGTLFVFETATRQPRLVVKGLGYATTVRFSPDGRLLALGNNGSHRLIVGDKVIDEGWQERGQVRLVDALTGKPLRTFSGHTGGVDGLAFSRDGKTLASASRDTTVLLWDVSACARAASGKELSPAEFDARWTDLRGDAAKAYRSIAALATAPPAEVVAFLKDRLHPVATLDAGDVDGLIKKLEDKSFAVREQAVVQLRQMGDAAEPALRIALASKPPLETARRVEQLLTEMSTGSERVRTRRAVEVLERLGTADARQLLRRLADGAPDTWLTREARTTLQRLNR